MVSLLLGAIHSQIFISFCLLTCLLFPRFLGSLVGSFYSLHLWLFSYLFLDFTPLFSLFLTFSFLRFLFLFRIHSADLIMSQVIATYVPGHYHSRQDRE
ncbi:hypothetical protein C8J56DRAFT_344887 [Mycena floridula]|nr:hypothetical protein C8J56DRAFT_344887 [Mycena floridula]